VISLTLIWDICHTGVWALGDKLRERFRRGLMVQKGAQDLRQESREVNPNHATPGPYKGHRIEIW
jgi:hypothetical protein